MRFTAQDAALTVLAREEYYSIGGGFIVQAGVHRRDPAMRAPCRPTSSTPRRGSSSSLAREDSRFTN